jgi:CO/xanthine dehydrogenase FAD-binding subunit
MRKNRDVLRPSTVEAMSPGRDNPTIPIADLHRPPGETPDIETSLVPDELITAVTLPMPAGETQIYRKVRDRVSYAFALVSVAAIVQANGSGRIALGGVAHKPWRVEAAEAENAPWRGSRRGAPARRRQAHRRKRIVAAFPSPRTHLSGPAPILARALLLNSEVAQLA